MKKIRRIKDYVNCSDEELTGYLIEFGRELAIENYKRGFEWDHLLDEGKKKRCIIPKDLKPMEPLFSQMWAAKDFPHPKIYIDRFGTWQNALYLAGFKDSPEDPHEKTTDELIDWLADNSSFSREFAAKMLDGVNLRKWHPRKKRKKEEANSNSYECSLPAYHLA